MPIILRHVPLTAYAVWTCWIWQQVRSQVLDPYATLSSSVYIDSADGSFTWPSGEDATFDEGSSMTIRWNSTYPSINLYSIYRDNISYEAPLATQIQIVTGNSDNSVQWTVSCNPDCGRPYVFRAVNAEGSAEDRSQGGFWSRLFWISPSGIPSTSTSTVSSASSTSLSLTAMITTEKSSILSTSSAALGVATAASEVVHQAAGSTNTTALGAGIGGGIGGVLLLLVGAFFLWRHIHNKDKEQQAQLFRDDSKTPHYYSPVQIPVLEADSESAMHEVGGPQLKSPIEAPPGQTNVHELPGREDR